MRRIRQANKPVSGLTDWYFKDGKIFGKVVDNKHPMDGLTVWFSVIKMNLTEGWAESQMARYNLMERREERGTKQAGSSQSNA